MAEDTQIVVTSEPPKPPPGRRPKVCTVEGCGRPTHGGPYCATHWRRNKLGLEMTAPIHPYTGPAHRRARGSEPLQRKPKDYGRGPCTYPGCTNPAYKWGKQRLCATHRDAKYSGRPVVKHHDDADVRLNEKKLCSREECGRNRAGRSLYCERHAFKRGQAHFVMAAQAENSLALSPKKLAPSQKPARLLRKDGRALNGQAVRTCVWPGCERPRKLNHGRPSSKLCSMHASRKSNGTDMNAPFMGHGGTRKGPAALRNGQVLAIATRSPKNGGDEALKNAMDTLSEKFGIRRLIFDADEHRLEVWQRREMKW